MASTRINVSETACDLGVVIDSQLSLFAQVAAVCRSIYYQLRQLRPLVRSMSTEAVKTLVQAFISCRLDYCNSLFYGIAPARLVSGARRYDHVTPVLQELPVRCLVDFRMATLVYLSLPGMAAESSLSLRRLSVGLRRRSSSVRYATSRTCGETNLQQLSINQSITKFLGWPK